MSGKLTIVGTPIGNLEDISVRALRAFAKAEIVICEDTRRFGQLLKLLTERLPEFGLSFGHKQLISYRDQNHSRVLPRVSELIAAGNEVLLVSDSGMPLISDPGFKLVSELIKQGVLIDVIPGPIALATALVISGLPSDKFTFVGFLPRKSSETQRLFSSYLALEATLIAYESPERILKALNLLADSFPNRQIAVACELTKLYQRVYKGTAKEIVNEMSKAKPRGEIVLLVGKEQFHVKGNKS